MKSDEQKKSPIKPPPNYSSRPMQYRLMMLVGMLMAVILLMFEAAKPKNWEWMWRFQNGDVVAAKTDGGSGATDGPIDTRLTTQTAESSSHPSDSFIAEIDDGSDFDSTPQLSLNELTRETLGPIQDDTYFRADENRAWFTLFGILQRTPLADLESHSLGEISFAQLFRQTEEFRGQLVTVKGTVRRVHQVPAAKNDLGIETYWQCWVRPKDGSNAPIVVYSLDLPQGFPTGLDVRQQVTFTGFCFKRWAYNSASGAMIAPILLAKTPVLREAPTLQRPALSSDKGITAITVGGVAGLGIAALVMLATRSHFNRKRFNQHEDKNVAELAVRIKGEQLPTIADKLRDLESTARRNE